MLGVKCHLYTERIQISSFIFTVIFLTVYLGCSILNILFSREGNNSNTLKHDYWGLRNSEDIEVNEDDCKCSHEQHEDAVIVCFVSPYL